MRGYKNDTGAPIKPPGRKATGKVIKGPYRFAPDVAEILSRQLNATAYLEELVRLSALTTKQLTTHEDHKY